MTYESTGEVRAPKQGEFYLNSNCQIYQKRLVTEAQGDHEPNWIEVIMRPVEEPKTPVQYNIVLPFNDQKLAVEALEEISQTCGYVGTVEPVYE